MHELLQWTGGGFYLLNKIFLWGSEYAKNLPDTPEARRWRIAAWVVYFPKARQWRIAAWAIYLLGLPPWVIIFAREHNWIAAWLELGGGPAMYMGLLMAIRNTEDRPPPRWLDRIVRACIVVGVSHSIYDFGGLTTFNQALESLLVLGYLVGTYQLAKEIAAGYLWYILMHLACGWLMWIQGYQFLFWMQLLSLVFIANAYRASRRD